MAEQLTPIRLKFRDTDRESFQFLDLDGTRFGLKARWSKRTSLWYLWLFDLDETQLAGPIALVNGIDLLRPYKYLERVPKGQLFVYSADRSPPTVDNLDTEATLYYRAVS